MTKTARATVMARLQRELEKLKREKPELVFDAIERPAHYNTGRIEVVDFIADQKLNFALGNVVKYVARSAHKGSQLEDLKKARHYLNREIAVLESR